MMGDIELLQLLSQSVRDLSNDMGSIEEQCKLVKASELITEVVESLQQKQTNKEDY